MTTSSLEWALLSGADIPDPQSSPTASLISTVQTGGFEAILTSPAAQGLLTPHNDSGDVDFDFSGSLGKRLDERLGGEGEGGASYEEKLEVLVVGIAALNAFLQSNITGPPLGFRVPGGKGKGKEARKAVNERVIRELGVEGEAVYHLIPQVLLFALARGVLCHAGLEGLETSRWWRMRVNFLHQRLLEGEKTGLLYEVVYRDLEYLVGKFQKGELGGRDKWVQVRFLVEKAQVDTFFGYEKAAREGLERAAGVSGLRYALTGVLGKRTRFQERDLSQLVVLARSGVDYVKGSASGEVNGGSAETDGNGNGMEATKPKTLDLNDDTLLETISFTKKEEAGEGSQTTTIVDDETKLPEVLRNLDPAEQPPLHPLDAAILLLLTETIKNNNPATGITREQMAPYAERVLKHSTNWEVYTIALLVRCRIEGHRSRTAERGLLQLQALVDQVIAETTLPDGEGDAPTTFLPRPKSDDESAPIRERLEYIYQLPAPTRWELEAELAHRWVSMGGLRTALEIYERLQMWAEVALCYAATDKEDKARRVVRNQLLHPVPIPQSWVPANPDDEYTPTQAEEAARQQIAPPPNNAPRLWSILGDIDNDPAWHEMAWEVSQRRYARAKRSLGRYWYSQKEPLKAAEAYAQSLNVNQLNKESWFLLGCCRLDLEDWEGGVEAFRRVTVLDEEDAEAWSNLASCLLRRTDRGPGYPSSSSTSTRDRLDDEEEEANSAPAGDEDARISLTQNRRDALSALKKASSLKFDNWRIWENQLIVAASIPSYPDVAHALSRLLTLRGATAGESCIDTEILSNLLQHVISTSPPPAPTASAGGETQPRTRTSLPRRVVALMETQVVPLITKDARLWALMARIALWRGRPREALECHEKAFRCVSRRWDVGEAKWGEVVAAAVDMVDAYRGLGELVREGLANEDGGEGGVLVARDWRFKARSVLRKVMGWGRKEGKEDAVGEGWERLVECAEELKE